MCVNFGLQIPLLYPKTLRKQLNGIMKSGITKPMAVIPVEAVLKWAMWDIGPKFL